MNETIQDSKGDLIFIEATGFSMWPFLKAGERLVIKKVPIEDLCMGDIILYKSIDHKLVCHRLVKKVKNKGSWLLFARGDNARFNLEPVEPQMFLGKLISSVSNGRIIDLNTKKSRIINVIIVTFSPWLSVFVHLCLPLWKRLKKLVP